ncbi:hypothetical protein SAMN05192541_101366 [Bradyrhizobium arachidis]|nr:hypothetical protein SAMN05192541_101366 [Bradyrhizobium arachidis]
MPWPRAPRRGCANWLYGRNELRGLNETAGTAASKPKPRRFSATHVGTIHEYAHTCRTGSRCADRSSSYDRPSRLSARHACDAHRCCRSTDPGFRALHERQAVAFRPIDRAKSACQPDCHERDLHSASPFHHEPPRRRYSLPADTFPMANAPLDLHQRGEAILDEVAHSEVWQAAMAHETVSTLDALAAGCTTKRCRRSEAPARQVHSRQKAKQLRAPSDILRKACHARRSD